MIRVVKLLFVTLFSLAVLAVVVIVALFSYCFIGCDTRKDVWDEVMFQTRPGMTCEEVFEKVLNLTKWQKKEVCYEKNVSRNSWAGDNEKRKDCPGISIKASYEYDGFLRFENVEFVFDDCNRLVQACVTQNCSTWKPKWAEKGRVELRAVGDSMFPLCSIADVGDSARIVRTLAVRRNKNARGVPLRFKERVNVSYANGSRVDGDIVRVIRRDCADSDCAFFDIEIDESRFSDDGTRLKVEIEYAEPIGAPPIPYEFQVDDIRRGP